MKAADMDSSDSVGKAFVEFYYTTLDADRAGLANLYQDESVLTFDGQKVLGSQNIVGKLTSLPSGQLKHHVNTVDCQKSGPDGGVLVFVSGNIVDEQQTLNFSQTFLLMLTPQGNYFVLNDIFRLNFA